MRSLARDHLLGEERHGGDGAADPCAQSRRVQARVLEVVNSGRRFDDIRLFEWTMAIAMIAISFTITYDPRTVAKGGFYLLENLWLTPSVLTMVFLVAGFARMTCLYANGRWPFYGPRCRAICSLVGALIWGEMCLSLAIWSSQTDDYLSLGVAVYFSLVCGESYSCFRAARDGRTY